MRSLVFVMALILFTSGCQSGGYSFSQASVSRVSATYTIELSKQWFKKCVSNSDVKGSNCKKPRKNVACASPEDTIIWKWKKTGTDLTFKITPKEKFDSPFDLASTKCTEESKKVTCTILAGTIKHTFFDYNIKVNDGDSTCTFDPRLLIY